MSKFLLLTVSFIINLMFIRKSGEFTVKKNINLEIGERVRLVRVSRGLSREELAEILGISALFVGYIECGQRGMSLATLQKICKALNVSADYILMGNVKSEDDKDVLIEAIEELEPQFIALALEQINNLKRTIAIIRHKNDVEK